jgi:IS5 family transposase
VDVSFGGVSSAAANAIAPANATPKSAGASRTVRGKTAREVTTSRSARYAARAHPGRHASTTNQESKCLGTSPPAYPERSFLWGRVG